MADSEELFRFSDEQNSCTDDSAFEFADESHTMASESDTIPWKLLVVDDDNDIHSLTHMVLKDYSFENRALVILSAYSGEEAIQILKTEEDIALVLLDVVMETDDAGLQCVKKIRDELKNHTVRIILRTGQPGQAPEQEVIVNYDINDYKAKTELTAQKLFTVVTASLRSYRHIKTIYHNRLGLENIISASSALFELKSFSQFASGILNQLTTILSLDRSSLYINISSLSAIQQHGDNDYKILAGTGEFSDIIEGVICDKTIPNQIQGLLDIATDKQESHFTDSSYTGYFATRKGEHNLLYLQWDRKLSEIDRDLISIFATNIAVAFENISLNNEIMETQREVVFTLSEVVEGRSKETANHIRRVAEVSCMLARKLGMSDHDIAIIKLAAPMHDIGKIGTPDSILKKPGKLTAEEFDVMKEHSTLGYNIFRNSTREVMVAAGIIAHQHHEKWNGKGYPQGLKGEEIHIYGRITALADVVDALANKRCYKDAWSLDRIISLIKEERGNHFDANIVDAFLGCIEEYLEIQKILPTGLK